MTKILPPPPLIETADEAELLRRLLYWAAGSPLFEGTQEIYVESAEYFIRKMADHSGSTVRYLLYKIANDGHNPHRE